MQKRGQVTTFIILGLLIVIAIILLLVILKVPIGELKTGPSEEIARQLQIESIKEYVDSCVKDTANNGLYIIGLQGGYINLPDKVLEIDNIKIAYGYYKGKNVNRKNRNAK